MIIVSITGPSTDVALAQMALARSHADMFELRLDLLRNPDLRRLTEFGGRPVVATCRPRAAGGGFRGSERRRKDLLCAAVSSGAAYVDVEWTAHRDFLREFLMLRPVTRVIVSHHLKADEAAEAGAWYRRLESTGADVIKFAYHAQDVSDCIPAFEFLAAARKDRVRAVAIAMGTPGELTRVLYRKFGGWGTYAAADLGSNAAPGQLSARVLKTVYRAHVLDRATRLYGVVGNPVAQSKGPYLHNAHFQRLGMNAVYCRCETFDIDRFMRTIMPLLDGCSVTIPFKRLVLSSVDAVDPAAEAIGAVNTIVRRRGVLRAFNTDAPAALDALEERLTVNGKRLLVLGAGGAARAVAFEAIRRGAHVVLANRTRKKAVALARDCGGSWIPWHAAGRDRARIVVNTTPLGMVPRVKRSPVQGSLMKGKVVLDAVFNPSMTRFLRDARRAGARVISGTEWFLNQAAAQALLFSGKAPSRPFLARVLQRNQEEE